MLYHLIKIKYIKLFIWCINIQSMVFPGYLNIIFVKTNLIRIIYLCGGTKNDAYIVILEKKIEMTIRGKCINVYKQFYDKIR